MVRSAAMEAAWKEGDPRVIHMEVGQPDHATPLHILQVCHVKSTFVVEIYTDSLNTDRHAVQLDRRRRMQFYRSHL
eukprot:COSAG02_NODE_2210_length_9492_cov_22.862877_4_plen_76_part_00